MYNLTKREFEDKLKDITHIAGVLVRNNRKWWQPNGWLYSLIRLALNTEYNHSAIVLYMGAEPCLVMQAIGKGVVAHYYGDWLNSEKREIFWLPCHELNYARTIYSFGQPYDYWKYARAVFEILNMFSFFRKEPTKPPFYCFELTAYLTTNLPGPHTPKTLMAST